MHIAPAGTWRPPVRHPTFEEQLLKSLQKDPHVLTVQEGGWRGCCFEFPSAFLIAHQAPLAPCSTLPTFLVLIQVQPLHTVLGRSHLAYGVLCTPVLRATCGILKSPPGSVAEVRFPSLSLRWSALQVSGKVWGLSSNVHDGATQHAGPGLSPPLPYSPAPTSWEQKPNSG